MGERLEQAASAAFQAGAKQVVLIGTDSPDLDASGLSAALTKLRHTDVVLGPAVDGDYYLIGLNHHRAELFTGIAAPGWALRCVEWAANGRSWLFQMPYGDQGLFISADTFFASGGYPNWPLMEDYELCRRLRRRGRIALAKTPILTSPRRWARLGVLRTTLINQVILLAFRLGVPPDRLVSWYTGRRTP